MDSHVLCTPPSSGSAPTTRYAFAPCTSITPCTRTARRGCGTRLQSPSRSDVPLVVRLVRVTPAVEGPESAAPDDAVRRLCRHARARSITCCSPSTRAISAETFLLQALRGTRPRRARLDSEKARVRARDHGPTRSCGCVRVTRSDTRRSRPESTGSTIRRTRTSRYDRNYLRRRARAAARGTCCSPSTRGIRPRPSCCRRCAAAAPTGSPRSRESARSREGSWPGRSSAARARRCGSRRSRPGSTGSTTRRTRTSRSTGTTFATRSCRASRHAGRRQAAPSGGRRCAPRRRAALCSSSLATISGGSG